MMSSARAMVLEPSLLLADEPTGNLDSRTGKDVMDLIRDLNRSSQMTVVLVTHEQNIADAYAERMISLADGKVISDVPRAKTAASRGDA
jgi:putative ABC transport system ATP-binding protein